jgi:hypothetical protein
MSESFGGISRWPQVSLEKSGMMLHSAGFNSVWKNIWTAVADDFKGLAADKIFSNTKHGMAKNAGCGEINMEHMAELFISHS